MESFAARYNSMYPWSTPSRLAMNGREKLLSSCARRYRCHRAAGHAYSHDSAKWRPVHPLGDHAPRRRPGRRDANRTARATLVWAAAGRHGPRRRCRSVPAAGWASASVISTGEPTQAVAALGQRGHPPVGQRRNPVSGGLRAVRQRFPGHAIPAASHDRLTLGGRWPEAFNGLSGRSPGRLFG